MTWVCAFRFVFCFVFVLFFVSFVFILILRTIAIIKTTIILYTTIKPEAFSSLHSVLAIIWPFIVIMSPYVDRRPTLARFISTTTVRLISIGRRTSRSKSLTVMMKCQLSCPDQLATADMATTPMTGSRIRLADRSKGAQWIDNA